MNIDRQTAIAISNEIDAAVAAILAKHDLVASPSKTTYGESYQIKITASPLVKSDTGINMGSPEAQAFIRNASLHGIAEPHLCFAETIHVNGKEYALVGYKPRARKRPFIMRDCETGKQFVFTDDVARYFPTYDVDKDFVSDYARRIRAAKAPKATPTEGDPFGEVMAFDN